eukprot:1141233-Pelagomonas_calceolata.AAC.1
MSKKGPQRTLSTTPALQEAGLLPRSLSANLDTCTWARGKARVYKGFTMVAYSPRLWLMAA